MPVNVTYIHGNCVVLVSLPDLTRASFLAHSQVSEAVLQQATEERAIGMTNDQQISLVRLSTNDVVTVINSDWEAIHYVCPKNSASIEKDDE